MSHPIELLLPRVLSRERRWLFHGCIWAPLNTVSVDTLLLSSALALVHGLLHDRIGLIEVLSRARRRDRRDTIVDRLGSIAAWLDLQVTGSIVLSCEIRFVNELIVSTLCLFNRSQVLLAERLKSTNCLLEFLSTNHFF